MRPSALSARPPSQPRYIRHVTLTTGHVRDSWRHEISDEALRACQSLITQITAAEGALAKIPGVGEYWLSGVASGGCLVCTVWSGPPSVVISTIGVAAHSRCGSRLWHELHRWGETPVVTDPERCPPEPWVAAALDRGIAHHLEAARWLGDFERCLAWAWIESRSADR